VVQSKFNESKRFVLNEKKSTLVHSCNGANGRKRNYSTSHILALPAQLKIAVEVAESPEGLSKVTESLKLPPLSHQVALGLVRSQSCPSEEQMILETSLLLPWFEECRKVDPSGTYVAVTETIRYNGVECTILKR
jgi:hypothetical protein